MAQHANPKFAGHELRERAHLTSSSMRPVMTLCDSLAKPSSRMSSISPTCDLLRCFPGFLGQQLATLGADTADRRGQGALRAHLTSVADEVTDLLQGTPVETAAGHLVHERQEEQHREDDD